MALVPLKIPPGIYANGTEYESAGHWRDSSLIRWDDLHLLPIGGWRTRFEDVTTDPCRSIIAWQEDGGTRWLGFGSANELFVSTAAGTITDITPGDLAAGDVEAGVKTGYGNSFYGTSFYGTERPDIGIYSEATTWSLDNFGEYLVACSTSDGRLLEWQLDTLSNAAPITNAPTDNLGLIVTEERFLFALGAGGNPRKVQWSDREANTVWTPAATNEAGDIDLQTTGQIISAVRSRGNTLILTDVDAHTATYIGPPLVYSFERVGSACGLIARNALTATPSGVFWMSSRGFFVFDGQSVNRLDCSASDRVFEDINTAQISKCWAMSISEYAEVWWFYPSVNATECDKYITYSYASGVWSTGSLSRTSGLDSGVFRNPIMTDSVSNSYEHEVGLNYDGNLPFIESGPISIANGDQVMKVNMLIPDESPQGGVTVDFKTKFYPNGTEREYGPYVLTNPTDVRFTGRQIKMRITGIQGKDWRVGTMRINGLAGGNR